MLFQPLFDVWVGVGPVVVENQVEIQSLRGFTVDFSEKLQEFNVPMLWVTRSNNGAFEHIQSSKEARGAVAFVVMGPWCHIDLSSTASPAGCGQVLESGISRPPKIPGLYPAVQDTRQRRR